MNQEFVKNVLWLLSLILTAVLLLATQQENPSTTQGAYLSAVATH